MSKETTKEKELKKVSEGPKAVDALFDALDKDGLLVKQEQEKLQDKVKRLEHEVNLLKDLVARAIQVKHTDVLKG
jgi:hypothetical protein